MGAQRKKAALGDSWEEAYISSSDNTPTNSASSQSDNDLATPLPTKLAASAQRTRRTRGSASKGSPLPATRTTRRTSVEPHLIMPSMDDNFNKSGRPLKRSNKQSMYTESNQEERSPRHHARRVRHGDREEPSNKYGNVQALWTRFLQPSLIWTVEYLVGVLGKAMDFLKPMISFLLCLILAMYAMQYSKHLFYDSVLAPVCYLPGSSYLIPFCSNTRLHTKPITPPPNFEELSELQTIFADVMEANKDSYWIPAELGKGKTAMSSLKLSVKYSSLPSRAELTNELDNFIEATDQTIDQLIDYNSNVGYTVDRIIYANKYALQNLDTLAESAAQRTLAASQNPLSRALSALNPWALTPQAAQASLEHNLFEQYVSQLAILSAKIDTLTQSAYTIKTMLKDMDQLATVIAEIGHQDHITITTRHADVKSSLWFGIVGNGRSKLKDFDRNLQLINELFRHRDVAAEAVSATIQKLGVVNADLARLKEDVEAPRLELESGAAAAGNRIGAAGFAPPSKPLKYHIDLVSQTTERLMEVRNVNARIAESARSAGAEKERRQKTLPGKMRDRWPVGGV